MRRSLLVPAVLIACVAAPAAAFGDTPGSASAPAAPASTPAAPSATIGAVDCINGGAFANLSNTGGQPATFTIQRDGATIDTVTLDSSNVGASRLVPIAEGRTSVVTVQMSGAGYVSSSVTRDCIAQTAPTPPPVAAVESAPAAADAAPAAPGEAAVTTVAGPASAPAASTGAGDVATDAAAASPTTPAATGAAATPTGALPFTGARGTVALLLAGALLTLAGAALHRVTRLRYPSAARPLG